MPTNTQSGLGHHELKLYHTNHTVETLAGTLPSGVATSSVSKVGVKQPNWRRRVRLCVDATGPYVVDAIQDGLIQGSISATGKVLTVEGGFDRIIPFKEYWEGPFLGNPKVPAPSAYGPAADDTQARMAFLQHVRSLRTQFQGGVFLGELKEAIHMIVRPAQALRSAVDVYLGAAKEAARRGKGKKAITRAIAGTWLEKSYGWVPMFSDIDSAMKALATTGHLVPCGIRWLAHPRSWTSRNY